MKFTHTRTHTHTADDADDADDVDATSRNTQRDIIHHCMASWNVCRDSWMMQESLQPKPVTLWKYLNFAPYCNKLDITAYFAPNCGWEKCKDFFLKIITTYVASLPFYVCVCVVFFVSASAKTLSIFTAAGNYCSVSATTTMWLCAMVIQSSLLKPNKHWVRW